MPSLAEQIAMRAPAESSMPMLPPSPMTPESVLDLKRRNEVESEDPWDVAQNVSNIVRDPKKMQSVLDNVAADFDEHAPTAAMDARLTTSRMLYFLASKAPKATFTAHGMPEVKPIKSEIDRFERYMKAIKDPTAILDDALDGTLTKESIESVREVYPNLYSQMQADLADRIINAEKIPYNRKLQLSALLGQDMAGTLKPQLAMSAQAAYQQAAQPPAPVIRGRPMKRFQAEALQGTASRAGRETAAWREAQQGARVGSGTR